MGICVFDDQSTSPFFRLWLLPCFLCSLDREAIWNTNAENRIDQLVVLHSTRYVRNTFSSMCNVWVDNVISSQREQIAYEGFPAISTLVRKKCEQITTPQFHSGYIFTWWKCLYLIKIGRFTPNTLFKNRFLAYFLY